MLPRVRLKALLAIALITTSCGDASSPSDGGGDANAGGAGGAAPTGGSPDGGAPDGGAPEGGAPVGGAPEGGAAEGGAIDPGPAALPPWLSYCEDGGCSATPAVVYVCPTNDPSCTPSRHTTVVPSVDGIPISAVFFPIVHPEGVSVRVASGPAGVLAHLVTAQAPAVEIHSDLDITISYYDLTPVWQGTTPLDFTSTTRTSSLLDSVFYAHPSFDAGTAADDLHDSGEQAIADERTITGVRSEDVHAFFMPSELAGVNGEGIFLMATVA